MWIVANITSWIMCLWLWRNVMLWVEWGGKGQMGGEMMMRRICLTVVEFVSAWAWNMVAQYVDEWNALLGLAVAGLMMVMPQASMMMMMMMMMMMIMMMMMMMMMISDDEWWGWWWFVVAHLTTSNSVFIIISRVTSSVSFSTVREIMTSQSNIGLKQGHDNNGPNWS